MKTPRIAYAVGHIDDKLVSETAGEKTAKKIIWHKWGSLAACFAVMLLAAIVAVPMLLSGNELVYEKGYVYTVNEESFSDYIGGKVIEEEKIGNKIADVSITAGWKNSAGEWSAETEQLRGEVYSINGISSDIAVALKFIDEGEAVTTSHYYVIMNPEADLSTVENYIITPTAPSYPSKEVEGEVLE